MASRAGGAFEVQLAPQQSQEDIGDPTIGRMALDKIFHGDLEATSKGEMLAVRTDIQGSAGYVAIERVRGRLHGRTGTFALQHSGIMTRGTPQLVITVIPDSGTEELAGLAGRMTIDISEGKHSYEFEYTLGDSL